MNSTALTATQLATYQASVQASKENRARISETLKAVCASLQVSK